ISAGRSATGSAIAGIDIDAVINHVTSRTVDSVHARLRGVQLPGFDLPGIPFRVNPGTGSSELAFRLSGSELFGRWAIGSDRVSWLADTAGRSLNGLERVVWRVLSGLKELNVVAELTGSITSPKLSVSSNLDRAIAGQVKAVIGEEVARAERMVRAKVDSLVADKLGPVKRQVAAVQAEAGGRVAGERKRIDEVERSLNAELKRLTAGLAPGIELPKIQL
ncbi:MAG TPA: hypothetical protein VD930_07605, partial [Gemmatimonadales bacterium]|nr:hypothetical protein [Gemmatimonadales bacterium]